MFNFLERIKSTPDMYRQFQVGDELITQFDCPLDVQLQDMWTETGYFVYVLEGKKIWHLPGQSFELTPGKCIFVRKGAHIVEQIFNEKFCVILFFVSDSFVMNTLRESGIQSADTNMPSTETIFKVAPDDALQAFFLSVIPYFQSMQPVNKILLELKFKELILNVANNHANAELTGYFRSLLLDSGKQSLPEIMEANFMYNLRLDDFARMCGKSLSAFKREFAEQYTVTPGKWLLERRLNHARILLQTTAKNISEVAFHAGFENVSHFSKSFRDAFGDSPTDYRKKPL